MSPQPRSGQPEPLGREGRADAEGRNEPARSPVVDRSYAGVARHSTSDSLEGTSSATRRWSREEMQALLPSAPNYRLGWVDDVVLTEVVARYEAITSDRVASRPKRNLVAACYRVHGEDFLPLVMFLFASRDTARNLLGEIRRMPAGILAGLQNEPPEPDEPEELPRTAPNQGSAVLLDEPPIAFRNPEPQHLRPPVTRQAATLFSDEDFGR